MPWATSARRGKDKCSRPRHTRFHRGTTFGLVPGLVELQGRRSAGWRAIEAGLEKGSADGAGAPADGPGGERGGGEGRRGGGDGSMSGHHPNQVDHLRRPGAGQTIWVFIWPPERCQHASSSGLGTGSKRVFSAIHQGKWLCVRPRTPCISCAKPTSSTSRDHPIRWPLATDGGGGCFPLDRVASSPPASAGTLYGFSGSGCCTSLARLGALPGKTSN